MELKIKIKPLKLEATNKDRLITSISKLYGLVYPVYSNNLRNVLVFKDLSFCVVYNIQKVNRKTKQLEKIKKNGLNKTISTIIREKKYIAYIYKFNMNLIRDGNLHIKQNVNNFEITQG